MNPTLTPAERLTSFALGTAGLLLSAWSLAASFGLLGWSAAADSLAVLTQGVTGRAV